MPVVLIVAITMIFSTFTRIIQKQHERLGTLKYIIATTVEFVTGAFLAMNIFIYGLSNTIDIPMMSTGVNFIEAFLLIALSVPIIGPSLGWVLGIGETVGNYHVYRHGLLMYVSAFIISTVTFGVVYRLIRMGRSKNK